MTQDRLILAIDQGTTSTRALVFNKRGEVVAKAQRELPLITPKSGWVEQDATRIWSDVVAVCEDALVKVDRDAVIGIGITNQRETTIVWDGHTGEPVFNAIVWQDRRTADFCNEIKCYESDIQATTGLLVDPYFSATKIRWILNHIGGYRAGLLFGTIDSFLLWKLTGGKTHATDVSNASRTMLFNIHKMEWSVRQSDMMGVPVQMLPEVKDNSADFGETTIFGESLPILAMAGDQQAATFGQACFHKGMVKSTYGTGCFTLMNTGEECLASKNRLLSTIAWRIDGQTTYALEGSIFVAGAAVQFLRDNLKFVHNAPESEALAMSVDDTDGVVFVPSFTGLGAPHWVPEARGALFGLSRGTSQAHIIRAVLDAQAYQTRDLVTAMTADMNGEGIAAIRVDGGLVSNDYVCQQIANQTHVPIERPLNTEATVWGAAAMAFLQAGEFSTLDDIAATYALDRQFIANADASQCDRDYARWERAIDAVKNFI